MSSNLNVCFRVRASSSLGMGHLARCSHLARELQARGAQITFIVDQNYQNFDRLLAGFDVIELYSEDSFQNETDDATHCMPYLRGAIVVVDDYRLSQEWEREARKLAQRIIVIDDLANRIHDCDLLIDQKWSCDGSHLQRYRNLIPLQCERALGPDYALLDSAYARASDSASCNDGTIKLLFSLGGGGDLSLLTDLVARLASLLNGDDLEFQVVVGPAAINADSLTLLEQADPRVSRVEGRTCLAEVYRDVDLYVGAAGTSIYELNCLRVPSLLFSLSDNQSNDILDLEGLGHYFYLSYQEFLKIDDVAQLVLAMLRHLPQIREMVRHSRVQVDGKGIARIADRVQKVDVDHFVSAAPGKSDSAPGFDAVGYRKQLSQGIAVVAVSIDHVNRYLNARNLVNNRQNMTICDQISRLEHYLWWFSNKRQSYVLNNGDEDLLYIWHEVRCYKGQDYLIGGWFVCGEDCGFDIATLALKWQLEMTAQAYPGVPWLAVIAKDNKFVNLLNKYMGFTPTVEASRVEATNSFFPSATQEHFNYVELNESP